MMMVMMMVMMATMMIIHTFFQNTSGPHHTPATPTVCGIRVTAPHWYQIPLFDARYYQNDLSHNGHANVTTTTTMTT